MVEDLIRLVFEILEAEVLFFVDKSFKCFLFLVRTIFSFGEVTSLRPSSFA